MTGGLRVGGLFSGTGSLDMAAAEVFGAEHAWFCEHEPATEKTPNPRRAAERVLAHRFPDVPNLGDVTTVDWASVEPVDIMVAGYPCVSQSQAGLRLGQDDDRWLWPAYREAIRAIRPRWALGENVAGHVTMDLRTVVADLQEDGYAVAWVTVAASDVGACHERRRVFWVAWPEGYGGPSWASKAPFAHLHAGQWGVEGLFGVDPVGQWPYQGAAYQGAAYQGAAYQGAAPVTSLLPTPRTTDTNGVGAHGDGGLDLRTTVADLLPTVNAALGDTHRGGWPNPQVAAARLAAGKRYLDDAISVLLPTPTVRDVKGDNQRRDASCLTGALLPTTTAADAERTSGRYARGNPTLIGALLPTVTVTDANGGRNATAVRSNPSSAHHAGTTLNDAVWQAEDWGKYGPAIARWEHVTGRPAPAPTGPYGRNGEQRLCGKFTEWMMDMPPGWVTDVPGVSNKDAIRLSGNGVVRRQAVAAYRFLIAQVRAEVAA